MPMVCYKTLCKHPQMVCDQCNASAEEVDDLDEVLNESIMDSIVGKRKAAEARTNKKRKRKDDDDDDDDENGYSHMSFSHLRSVLRGCRSCLQ